jgi:hypothetical protein
LVRQRNALLDQQLVAQNERKKIQEERKLLEERTEPLLEDLKKVQYALMDWVEEGWGWALVLVFGFGFGFWIWFRFRFRFRFLFFVVILFPFSLSRAQHESKNREISGIQAKHQHVIKVLAQLETDNKLNDSKVAKREKVARKEVC